MASASLLKSSPTVIDKSEFVKGQSLRQTSVSVVRCHPTNAPSLTVRAASPYADELVKTAVSFNLASLSSTHCQCKDFFRYRLKLT